MTAIGSHKTVHNQSFQIAVLYGFHQRIWLTTSGRENKKETYRHLFYKKVVVHFLPNYNGKTIYYCFHNNREQMKD